MTHVPDHRGLGKRLKRALRPDIFRRTTLLFNAALACVPYAVKYPIGTAVRRRKVPYCFIEPGDVVVQVGAPRDLLAAGRSRAVHFARLVAHGRVVVVEPDRDNVAALTAFAARHDLGTTMTVIDRGAWREPGELTFLSSPLHPAANVIELVRPGRAAATDPLGYQRTVVKVDTLDAILRGLGLARPKLVSITTNGAEIEILEGLRETIAGGCPYISLASTGGGYQQAMTELGYEYLALDDRGYCFHQRRGPRAARPR